MKSIYLQASNDGSEEYELVVSHYSPPTPSTREDPGDDGEVDFEPVVNRRVGGRKVEEVPFDEFLEQYAAHEGIARDAADQAVRDQAMISIAEDVIDRYEDSLESALEDR
jgi:hypothetical protein